METQNQKNKSSSKIFVIFISIIVLALAATIGREIASNIFKPSKESIEIELVEIANEMNKKCPLMVDAGTRLDNTGTFGKEIIYNYTLIKYTTDEIDTEYLRSVLEPSILNGIKTHPEMKALRDMEVIFNYNYRDKNGKHVLTLKFTPKDYL